MEHPGDALAREMAKQKLSQKELAKRSGILAQTITKLAGGQKRFMPHEAKAIGKVLGTGAKVWLERQRRWDERD